MKYLTADGRILAADSTLEVLNELKNSSPFDANRSWERFLSSLAQRIYLYYGESIDDQDHHLVVHQLEQVGFLLKLE